MKFDKNRTKYIWYNSQLIDKWIIFNTWPIHLRLQLYLIVFVQMMIPCLDVSQYNSMEWREITGSMGVWSISSYNLQNHYEWCHEMEELDTKQCHLMHLLLLKSGYELLHLMFYCSTSDLGNHTCGNSLNRFLIALFVSMGQFLVCLESEIDGRDVHSCKTIHMTGVMSVCFFYMALFCSWCTVPV